MLNNRWRGAVIKELALWLSKSIPQGNPIGLLLYSTLFGLPTSCQTHNLLTYINSNSTAFCFNKSHFKFKAFLHIEKFQVNVNSTTHMLIEANQSPSTLGA